MMLVRIQLAAPLGHCRRPAIAAAQVICTSPVMVNCGLQFIHAVPPLAVSDQWPIYIAQ